MFFIEEGFVELFKTKEPPKQSLSEIYSKKYDMNLEDKIQDLMVKTDKKTELDYVKIGILGAMNGLGDDDYLCPRRMTRSYSAKVVSSELSVYELKESAMKAAFDFLGIYKFEFEKSGKIRRNWIYERMREAVYPNAIIDSHFKGSKEKRVVKKKKGNSKLMKCKLQLNPLKEEEIQSNLEEYMSKDISNPFKTMPTMKQKNSFQINASSVNIKTKPVKAFKTENKKLSLIRYNPGHDDGSNLNRTERRHKRKMEVLYSNHFQKNKKVSIKKPKFFANGYLSLQG
jgi:hypothetical protein